MSRPIQPSGTPGPAMQVCASAAKVRAHTWSVGDLAIWDNRAVLHRGHRWPDDQARVMVRTTVAGDDPDNEWAETVDAQLSVSEDEFAGRS